MAWLQSHQSLGQHPKLRRLSALLGVSKAQAVGHLHYFWWWCLEYAPSGDLVKYQEIDIAFAAEWPGDVADFIEAMESAGFIERGEHGWLVHDWRDYAGRLLERREADARRKAARRTQTSASRPADVQRTSGGHVADMSGRPTDAGSTVPNRTVPNRTEPLVAVADAPAPTKAVRPAPKPKATLTLLTDDWEPTPALLAWADGQGCPAAFLKSETDKFRDYHIGKKTRYAEWDRAWKNWIRKAVEIGAFNRPATAKNGSSSQSARDLDVLLQIANQAN